jgi:GT2 family glycosyltransferase
MMDVSIIILNYKSRGLLKQCLRGLLTLSVDFQYEIIVVDNNSGDGTDEMMRREFPAVLFFQAGENRGFAAGNNLGIKHAQGRYFLIMNPDISILNNTLEKMFSFMERHDRVGIAAPKLLNPDGSTQTSCRRFPSPSIIFLRRTPFGKLPSAEKRLRHYLMLDVEHDNNMYVDWVLGACMLVRRAAMERVGMMDERFFLYFEDVDWCRRFWELDFPIAYLGAEAELIHFHQRLSAVNPGLKGVFSYATRVHLASGVKYFAKYFQSSPPQHGTLSIE